MERIFLYVLLFHYFEKSTSSSISSIPVIHNVSLQMSDYNATIMNGSCHECLCAVLWNTKLIHSFNCFTSNNTCELFPKPLQIESFSLTNNSVSSVYFRSLPIVDRILTSTIVVHDTSKFIPTAMKLVTTAIVTSTKSLTTALAKSIVPTTTMPITTMFITAEKTTIAIISAPYVVTRAFTGASLLANLSYGAMNWTCFSFNWTATADNHTINFKFRQDSYDWYMDDVSILDVIGRQLIVNGGFEGGTFGVAISRPQANGWTWSGRSCRCCMGVVNTTARSGKHLWSDGCTSTTDNFSQSISTTIGQTYSISWWLKNGAGTAASFRASMT